MEIRKEIENYEDMVFIKEACRSRDSKGRLFCEKEDDVRTCFMVDRDRIIHSKAFRRLKHKTQVFIKTSSDHYRTRLTHTLEVSQIGRTIGKALRLNETLVEAVALCHDIGHVAFAHSGEEVLNELLPNGFRHNENSIRIVTSIEKDGKGLNLTDEVLDGVLYHSGFSKGNKTAYTLEGQIVKFSDKIAYVNHDIDDSIRAELLKEEELPQNIIKLLGDTNSKRIDTLVRDCIKTSKNNIERGILKIDLSEDIGSALNSLRNFMFENIYLGSVLSEEREKAKFVLSKVFAYYKSHPEKMPELYKNIAYKEGISIGVSDYISGMTDDYCIYLFNNIYMPKIVIF